jgi:hypothetical protein
MKANRLDKLTSIQGYIVTIAVAFLLGVILWLIYRWIPDFLPFAIAWVIVRPLFKIMQYIDREVNL